MRKLILAFLICCSTAAFAPKTLIPWTIKVDQQADHLLLSRINVDEQMQEQAPITETLSFDGTPFQRNNGDNQVTTTLNWSDGSSFVLTREGGQKATETWTLADNGQTLVIDRAVEQKSNGFKYEIKCYYTKQ